MLKAGPKQKYIIFDDIIGKGAYGTIKLAKHIATHKIYACKILPKFKDYRNQVARIEREISIWKELQGVPNVCPLIETFEDDENVFLIENYCQGGTIYEFIKSEYNNENNLKIIVKQILQFLATIHQMDIIYGDIKCHNIMFQESFEKSLYINMIDFGCSKRLDGNKYLRGIQGTPYFFPPEFSDRYITTKSDVWALGILVYYAILKQYPILCSKDWANPGDISKYITKISEHHFTYDGINSSCKDFLKNLFINDPDVRMSAKDALEHPWLSKN